MNFSISQQKLELSRDVLDDVELSRLPAEQLLLKASRLARLVEDQRTLEWLTLELQGYPNTVTSLPWMRHFGRLINEDTSAGYWVPLAGIGGMILAMQAQIQSLQVPHVSFSPSSANPNEFVTGLAGATARQMTEPAKGVLDRLQNLTTALAKLTSIRSRVLAEVHRFAVKIYHELAFGRLAETIFESQKIRVDSLIETNAPEILERLPSVYDRLAENDSEALSQAMNSVRRMIGVFADSVYPPENGIREVDGQNYDIGSEKTLNRIKLYLLDRCPSKSRVERLARAVRDIYDRASAGSHRDVTSGEARALFLAAYMTLGEILQSASEPPHDSYDIPLQLKHER